MKTRKAPFKLPFGCLVIAGIALTLCMGFTGISTLQVFFAEPSPVPTQTANETDIPLQVTVTVTDFQVPVVPSNTMIAENTPILIPTFSPTNLPIATETFVSVIPVTGASCIPNHPPQTGRVVDVVDGDTIKVLLDEDGLTYTVRYIGMDTPESTSQVKYFGPEATVMNFKLVVGKSAMIVKDVSEADRFGRLLRYVIVDNLFVNYELVAQGYANTVSYPPDVACISTFREAEEQASTSKLGLWSAPPAQIITVPTVAPSGGGGNTSSGGGGNAVCNCGGPDLNCSDFRTHSSAQACYDYCVSQGYGDIFGLDGNDRDGLACESLP